MQQLNKSGKQMNIKKKNGGKSNQNNMGMNSWTTSAWGQEHPLPEFRLLGQFALLSINTLKFKQDQSQLNGEGWPDKGLQKSLSLPLIAVAYQKLFRFEKLRLSLPIVSPGTRTGLVDMQVGRCWVPMNSSFLHKQKRMPSELYIVQVPQYLN